MLQTITVASFESNINHKKLFIMKELFLMGGAGFMSILTLLFVAIIAWYIYHFSLFMTNSRDSEYTLHKLNYGRSIGLFSMITGILGQLIGLYSAFSAIQKAGDISPALVYAGIKVSMITTLYGIFIYLFSILLWFLLSIHIEKRK